MVIVEHVLVPVNDKVVSLVRVRSGLFFLRKLDLINWTTLLVKLEKSVAKLSKNLLF